MEFWLWMPQLFACTRARIKTQINRGLSPIIRGLSPIISSAISDCGSNSGTTFNTRSLKHRTSSLLP